MTRTDSTRPGRGRPLTGALVTALLTVGALAACAPASETGPAADDGTVAPPCVVGEWQLDVAHYAA